MHIDLKKDFPLFKNYPQLIFADNASTTQKPRQVVDAVSNYYTSANANIHRAVYDLGVKSDEIYEGTRQEFCDFYGKEMCLFTGGTTDGFNKLARALEPQISSQHNIIVSEMEHHSNLIPWQEVCKRKGAELRITRLLKNGDLDIKHLESLVDKNTCVISLVHISNTLGTVNKLEKVSEIAEAYQAYFLVDAAQSCTLHRDEISRIRADAFVFGGHKMFGPSGIGVILTTQEFATKLPPFNYGGGMVTEVEHRVAEYREGASRFEAGTPPVAQVAGLRAALGYIGNLNLGQCIDHLLQITGKLKVDLESLNVRVLGSPEQHSGIVSAVFHDIHPHDVASYLNSKQIAVRAGHHCTQLIMKSYAIHSCVRFSFSVYNSIEEVDRIKEAIVSMNKFFS